VLVHITPRLVSWASEIEPDTLRQAEKTARLPIVEGHVALMPDAHVDIGCGMVAAELDVTEDQLPDHLEPLLRRIEAVIPAGVGKGHDAVAGRADRWLHEHRAATRLSQDQAAKAAKQFGTLGSGNHFFELCVDERSRVWVVLHSGSRGIGNALAQMHIGSSVVAGRGNAASWESCAHGAGRRHSRSRAKRLFTAADLAEQMKGKVWLRTRADALVDEIPAAYKDIDVVMADAADLVEVRHTLWQIVKGD
jgi:RNA-splicing ligase RtcB